MGHRITKDRDTEVDLESGLPLIGDDSMKASTPSTAKQEKPLFAKVSGGFAGGSFKGDGWPSSCSNESSSSEASEDLMKETSKPMTGKDLMKETNKPMTGKDLMKETNKPMMGKDSASPTQQTPVREKLKKGSNKKAPKPPRPPQAPLLDAADHQLIKELSELAMLKRARIERIKAMKKMKMAKSSSSSNTSSLLALVFTIVFFVVIIFQGMSSGTTSAASFQGSPVSAGESEGGLISVQYQLNPSSIDSNAPGSESHNFVQQVAGSDLPERPRRDSG